MKTILTSICLFMIVVTASGIDKALLEELKKVEELPLPPEKLEQLTDQDELCILDASFELPNIKSLPQKMKENVVVFVDFKVKGKDGKLADFPNGKAFMFFIDKDNKIPRVGKEPLKNLIKDKQGKGGYLCEVPAGDYRVLVLVKGPGKKLYGTVKKWTFQPGLLQRLPTMKKLPLSAGEFLKMSPFYRSAGQNFELFASVDTAKKASDGKAQKYHIEAVIGYKKDQKVIPDKLPDTAKISFILIGDSDQVLLYKTFKANEFIKKGFSGTVKPGHYQFLIWADIDDVNRIAAVISMKR